MSASFSWNSALGRCEPWCDAPCAELRQPFKDCSGCVGTGYLCRPSTLQNVTFASHARWSVGYCGDHIGRLMTRKGDEGNCTSGSGGTWSGRLQSPSHKASLTVGDDLLAWCLDRCRDCPRCAAVSASVQRRDCSWHAICARPLHQRGKKARDYQAQRVRTDREPARNCTVSSIPIRRCSRAHMYAWYLENERSCIPAVGDLYQFGVPSIMGWMVKLLEQRGLLATAYGSYWGFDSFEGLPEESAGSLKPNNQLWEVGRFATSRGHRFHHSAKTDTVRLWRARQFERHHRVRMVAGFFNVSLTARLAQQAHPARYVDLDCDLHVSTIQALRWLATHQLLVPGTLIGYDDWYEAPFLRGGESLAHVQIVEEFALEMELLAPVLTVQGLLATLPKFPCRSVVFRVASVGAVTATGITRALAEASCRVPPLKAPLRIDADECTRTAEERLRFAKVPSEDVRESLHSLP